MMTTSQALPSPWVRWRCPYRLVILMLTAILLLGSFWLLSRYPQLWSKSGHVGQGLPSMAFSGEVLHVERGMPAGQRVVYSAINWLDGMKIGMSFGVALGALLHTVLKYYPLRIGTNLYLNSVKGALVGVPAGICANCAVPVACGVTRGHGRVEVALGFLFSSPNFNPLVVVMTFAALPLSMALTKYGALLLVIVVLVPGLISFLERGQPLKIAVADDFGAACDLRARQPCEESWFTVLAELGKEFGRNAWMLLKPTLAIMLFGSLLSALLLVFVPWPALLANTTPLVMLGVAVVATLMPVPIALDVLFAALLLRQGVAPGYVMLFAMTLGVYSIVPSIYLWREVSKPLSVSLFVFFVLLGWGCGLLF